MSVLHLSPTVGIAYPDDLKLLREIFDDICRQRSFHGGSGAADDLAKAIMDLFAQGIFEEDDLRENVEIYFGRKSAAVGLVRL